MRPARTLVAVTDETAELAALRERVSELECIIQKARSVGFALHEHLDDTNFAQHCLGAVLAVLTSERA